MLEHEPARFSPVASLGAAAHEIHEVEIAAGHRPVLGEHAGQATLALEAIFAFPEADAFVVPVGGGGLLAGVATVVKSLRPDALVIGVEPAHAPGLAVALGAGKPVRVPVSASLADGLAVAQTGEKTFAITQSLVDRVVTVTEDDLAGAVSQLHDRENVVVEGAGAAGLAACLSGKLPELARKQVVVPLTGRNIDPLVHAPDEPWTTTDDLGETAEAIRAARVIEQLHGAAFAFDAAGRFTYATPIAQTSDAKAPR